MLDNGPGLTLSSVQASECFDVDLDGWPWMHERTLLTQVFHHQANFSWLTLCFMYSFISLYIFIYWHLWFWAWGMRGMEEWRQWAGILITSRRGWHIQATTWTTSRFPVKLSPAFCNTISSQLFKICEFQVHLSVSLLVFRCLFRGESHLSLFLVFWMESW